MKYLLLILLLSSCRLLNESSKKKDSSESVSSSSSQKQESKTDTSRGTSEKTNVKETTFYPQPIIIPGSESKPAQIVFVPQTVKESTNEKDEWWMNKFEQFLSASRDTASTKQDTKEKQSETKAGMDTITIILIVAVGLLFLKDIIPFIKLLKPKT